MPKPPTPRTSSRRHSRITVPAGRALLLYALFKSSNPLLDRGYEKENRTIVKRLLVGRHTNSEGRMGFECISRTHVGLKRKINEDSVFVDSERGLWAVADGMGGHEAGEVASGMVTEALGVLPRGGDLDGLVAEGIAALQMVNGKLIDLARSIESDRTIGTTVVGLAIADGSYRCFWAGDSRAYRIRHGEIARLSHDHSLVQDLVDA